MIRSNITHDRGWFVGTGRDDAGKFICEADCEGPTEERSEPGGRPGSGRRFCGETVRAYCDQESNGRRRHDIKEHSERNERNGARRSLQRKGCLRTCNTRGLGHANTPPDGRYVFTPIKTATVRMKGKALSGSPCRLP